MLISSNEEFARIFPLKGRYYYAIASGIRLHLLGHFLRYTRISGIGDLRMPLLVIMPSGSGKQAIMDFLKYIITNCEGTERGVMPNYVISSNDGDPAASDRSPEGYYWDSFRVPLSLHPEQMVGKTVRVNERGKLKYVQQYGYLASNYICIDEAYELLTDDTGHENTRKYIIKALDPIGSNVIEKAPVDIPSCYAIRYAPVCSICMMSQPVHPSHNIVSRGFLRRFQVCYTEIPFEEKMEYGKMLVKSVDEIPDIGLLIDELMALKTLEPDVQIDNSAIEAAMEMSKNELYKMGEPYRSVMLMPFRNALIKTAILDVISRDPKDHVCISDIDVLQAYETLLPVVDTTFAFVNKYISKIYSPQVHILNRLARYGEASTSYLYYLIILHTNSCDFDSANGFLKNVLMRNSQYKLKLKDDKVYVTSMVKGSDQCPQIPVR